MERLKEVKCSYYDNGQKESETWLVDGLTHREDGPSFIEYFESGKVMVEEYWMNDKPGRLDGPTVINYNEDGTILGEEYFIPGMDEDEDKLTKEEFDKHPLLIKYKISQQFKDAIEVI